MFFLGLYYDEGMTRTTLFASIGVVALVVIIVAVVQLGARKDTVTGTVSDAFNPQSQSASCVNELVSTEAIINPIVLVRADNVPINVFTVDGKGVVATTKRMEEILSGSTVQICFSISETGVPISLINGTEITVGGIVP